jgi:hypothetical protein
MQRKARWPTVDWETAQGKDRDIETDGVFFIHRALRTDMRRIGVALDKVSGVLPIAWRQTLRHQTGNRLRR